MTVLVGIKQEYATILATDREENDGYIRSDVSKIEVQPIDRWAFCFSGAGTSAYIDYAIQQIRETLREHAASLTSAQVKSTIDTEILRICTDHIFASGIPDPNHVPVLT